MALSGANSVDKYAERTRWLLALARVEVVQTLETLTEYHAASAAYTAWVVRQ